MTLDDLKEFKYCLGPFPSIVDGFGLLDYDPSEDDDDKIFEIIDDLLSEYCANHPLDLRINNSINVSYYDKDKNIIAYTIDEHSSYIAFENENDCVMAALKYDCLMCPSKII